MRRPFGVFKWPTHWSGVRGSISWPIWRRRFITMSEAAGCRAKRKPTKAFKFIQVRLSWLCARLVEGSGERIAEPGLGAGGRDRSGTVDVRTFQKLARLCKEGSTP